MFCLNFLSRKKHQSDGKEIARLIETNESLVKKNAQLLEDNKLILQNNANLLVSNTKLRSINAKRKDENEALQEKVSKLKDTVRKHEGFRHALKMALPTVNFNGYSPFLCNEKSSDCIFDDHDCKKYTNLSICMMPNEITRSCKE